MAIRNGHLARLLNRHVKLVTFSFFLGFGLTACFGGESSTDEAMQPSSGEAAPATETATGDAAPQDAPAADTAASEAPLTAEDSGAVVEEMPATDTAATTNPGDTAPPPAVMDQPTDTVNAELTDGTDMQAAQTPPASDVQPAAAPVDNTSDISFNNTPAETAAAPEAAAPIGAAPAPEVAAATAQTYGTIASPGAAQFIHTSHERHQTYASKKHHHHTGAVASSGTVADGSYVVQSGDTLARIAHTVFGSAHAWQSLADANGLHAPFVIHPGQELKFDANDPKAAGFAKTSQANMKTVTVKKGDTLCKIAQQVFGSPHAWKRLVSYNKKKIADPNRIHVGMQLAYVDGRGSATAEAKTAAPEAAPAAAPMPVKKHVAHAKAKLKVAPTEAQPANSDEPDQSGSEASGMLPAAAANQGE